MNENADLIFGVDTSEAVGNLNRLSKALQGVYDQMGKGSANPSRALAKNTEEMGAAAKVASVEFDELARKANEAARVMVSSSRKIGDAYVSIRSEATSSAEAIKKWERALEEAANNPNTVAGYERQKKELKDLADYNERLQRNMTDALYKELDRRNKLVAQKDKELENYNKAVQTNMTELYYKELHRRSEVTRKENEKQLAYQRDLELNMQSLAQRHWKRQADYVKGVHDNMTQAYVGELRRREQAEREHQNTMARLEREGWNRKKRMDAEKIAYLSRSSASQLQLLEEINLLSNQGISTSALARRFGSFAVTQPRSEEAISALRKEVEAQRAVEAAERGLNKERSKSEGLLNRNTQAILRNNQAMADARGLARGLSGALGTLWMTYGAIGPLLTGAAIGNIARQTYQIGKDVEYRLAVIEALGNRAIKISEMMPAVHGSMKTPLEAAQGLQELAQAGLNADESLAVLSTTLQLATLGEMSVAEAALTATAALSTFHLGVDEAARVGDVFAKTASVSNTTVKGIAEAMKQAGSAASIYGVTLEETSAQTAVLAQNGIRGSAAGTAVRNAMTELHAPTEKARKLMEEFGIEMYKEGNISRNYMSVLEDLRSVYYSLDEAGQNALLKGMFNERSRRAIQIYMKDLDGLKKLYGEITDSQLFLLDANLRLLNTVEGASNRMTSVFQQTLVESFDNLQPHILSTIRSLEELFGSGGFQRTVQTIGGAVARLTEGLANHAGKISTVLGLYATWRIAMGLAGASYSAMIGWKERGNLTTTKTAAALELETKARERNTRANVANAAATATASSRWLSVGLAATRVLNIVGLASIVISASVSLWNSWRASAEKVDESQKNLAPTLDQVLKSLKEQNKELEKNIKLQNERARGVPEGTTNFETARDNAEAALLDAQMKHAAVVMEMRAIQQKAQEGVEGTGSRVTRAEVTRLRELMALDKELTKVITDNNGTIIKTQEELDEVQRKSREQESGRIRNTIQDLIKEATLRVEHGRNVSDQYKKGVEDIVEYDEKFRASGQKSLEEMEAHQVKVREMFNAIQVYLNSFDIGALDGWIKSQREAEDGSRGLAAAVSRGTEAVTKYTIEQAALKQTTEFTQKSNEDYEDVLRRVTQALWDAHYAESSLNAARQISNIQEKTRELQEQLGVLRAYTKGADELAKAEEELAYNRGMRQVLEGVAPGDQPAVAMTYHLAWEKLQDAKDSVKTQEAINRAYTEGLSPLEQYTQKRKELNDLYEKASTDEERAIVTKRLAKLEEDYAKSQNNSRGARQIERLDVWIAKKDAEAEATRGLTKAYLEGEASLLEYNIQKEATVKAQEYANKESKEFEKIVDRITEAVRTLNTEQARLEIAKQVNDLNKQTKASDDYVKVLLAQSKGYKQGEAALKAFNKEQARTALLSNLSADNLDDVLDILKKFDAAYDASDASADRNKNLEKLNDLVNQTKNSTQKYREEMEKLEGLRLPEASPEQLAALEQHMRNVTIESNDFLSTLNQGFVDLNQNANDMWRKFLEDGKFSMDSVKSLFRNMLADLAHQALTKPIIISLQNAVMGTNIGGGWGQVYGGGGGGAAGGSDLGSLVGLASGARNLWGAFSGGLTSTVSSGIASVGSAIGSSALQNFALGVSGKGASVAAGVMGPVTGGVNAGGAVGAGAMVGKALPYIGAALAAVSIGKMVHNMFKGETRVGGGFQYTAATGKTHFGDGPSGGYGGAHTLNIVDNLLRQQTDVVQGVLDGAGVLEATISAYTSTFESSEKGRGGTSSGGYIVIDGVEHRFGTHNKGEGYGGTSGTSEEMFENMTKDLAYSALEAWQMVTDRLPVTLNKMLDGINVRDLDITEAEQLSQNIVNITAGVNNLGEALKTFPMENFRDLNFDNIYNLADNLGSLEDAGNILSQFVQSYVTEAERISITHAALTKEFEVLGYALPRTKNELRDVISNFDLTTEEGSKLAAKMLELSGSFAELNDILIGKAIDSVQKLADEVGRLESAYKSSGGLLDKLAEALGKGPSFSLDRERYLWDNIHLGNLEQQLEMGQELSDLIFARFEREKKLEAEKVQSLNDQIRKLETIRDISLSLQDYLQSLKTSDLSPLTLSEKVAESEAEFNRNVEKALQGDEEAFKKVQGNLQESLTFWREYGASGQDYQDAYLRLTEKAGALALDQYGISNSQIGSLERQIESMERNEGYTLEQLAQIQNLYDLTQNVNRGLGNQLNNAINNLETEVKLLEEIGLSTEHLEGIFGILMNLSTDIAIKLGPLFEGLGSSIQGAYSNTITGWYNDTYGKTPDQEGLDYWVGQAQESGIDSTKGHWDNFSKEYFSLEPLVAKWYETHLGRKPDKSGLEYWTLEAMDKGYAKAFSDFKFSIDGTHRDGLDYVPFDGYVAELHRGERVLTAQEARGYGDSNEILHELRTLREDLKQTMVEVGNMQARVTASASQAGANQIVEGVGEQFKDSLREETTRNKSNRQGLFR